MGTFNLTDIDLREVSHWFRDSWCYFPNLSRAVYIRSIQNRDDEQLFLVRDGFGRQYELPVEAVDPFVPPLGYIEYVDNGRAPNPKSTADYFYYGGEVSYKKGMCPDRIYKKYQEFYTMPKTYEFRVKTGNVMVHDVFNNPSFIDSAFNPYYRNLYEGLGLIHTGRANSVALSQNFALDKRKTPNHRGMDCASLFYRGMFIAPVDYDGKIKLAPNLNFLRERIEEEIPDAELIRL